MDDPKLERFKQLFTSVIWPAVAGNVAWALLTTVNSASLGHTEVWSRLISLVLLSFYLIVSVWRNAEHNHGKPNFFFVEGLYATSIALYAISTQYAATSFEPNENAPVQWDDRLFWEAIPLFSMFVLLAVGHFCDFWRERKVPKLTIPLAWLNVAASIMVFVSIFVANAGHCEQPYLCWMFAMLLVLVPWAFLLKKEAAKG